MNNDTARRVLCVEDNAGDARLVRLGLEDEHADDLELIHVETLEEAAEAADREDFDVALLDLSLPDSQGIETYTRLQAASPELPIVVLTGAEDHHLALRAIKQGAQDYLVKDDTSSRILVRALRSAIERRQIDLRLRQAQRLEVVGQLAGGVAHDFNNLLTVIIGNLQLLEETVGDEECLEYASEALAAAERGAALAGRLLDFARSDDGEIRTVDLNVVIERARALLRRSIPETVDSRVSLHGEPLVVSVDVGQLEQVVLNLAINARDAMPDGGRLVIETSSQAIEGSVADKAFGLEAGDYAVLSISDSGCGMGADVLERACDPFFTTKGSGRGTGLGLAMAQSYVHGCGGCLRLYSEPGRGTTVRCYLPLAEGTAADLRDPTAEFLALQSSTLRVLLVEDDDHVRQTAGGMLRWLGHEVMEATCAEEALQRLRETDGIDLLFSDVVMPGDTDGISLARLAREIRPDLPVLLCSGYGETIAGAGVDMPAPVLTKPYSRKDLQMMIQELSR